MGFKKGSQPCAGDLGTQTPHCEQSQVEAVRVSPPSLTSVWMLWLFCVLLAMLLFLNPRFAGEAVLASATEGLIPFLNRSSGTKKKKKSAA